MPVHTVYKMYAWNCIKDMGSDTGRVLIKLQRRNSSSEAGPLSSHLPTHSKWFIVYIFANAFCWEVNLIYILTIFVPNIGLVCLSVWLTGRRLGINISYVSLGLSSRIFFIGALLSKMAINHFSLPDFDGSAECVHVNYCCGVWDSVLTLKRAVQMVLSALLFHSFR